MPVKYLPKMRSLAKRTRLPAHRLKPKWKRTGLGKKGLATLRIGLGVAGGAVELEHLSHLKGSGKEPRLKGLWQVSLWELPAGLESVHTTELKAGKRENGNNNLLLFFASHFIEGFFISINPNT